MYKILTLMIAASVLSACSNTQNEPNNDDSVKGNVYETTSETSITTTVDEELNILNQSGTSGDFSL